MEAIGLGERCGRAFGGGAAAVDALHAAGHRDEVVGRVVVRLGDDALQADRELRADLPLLRGREDVDDAVDGQLGGAFQGAIEDGPRSMSPWLGRERAGAAA